MQVEYKRDVNHNYLILKSEGEVNTSSYQVRMLAGNVIPHILKCRIQGLNGKVLFCYDITSRQSLETLFEDKKLGAADLEMIFGGFLRVMEEMTEYLMNPQQILFSPEYIYIDAESSEIYFCCFAEYEKPVQDQLRELTEYLLPKMDHQDDRAVMLGYGVYRKAMEEGLQLEEMKEVIYHRSFGVPKIPKELTKKQASAAIEFRYEDKMPFPMERSKEEALKEEIFEKKKKRETREKKRKKFSISLRTMILCAAAALVLLGIMVACYLGYLSWAAAEVVLGVAIVLLGICVITGKILERKRMKKDEQEWQKISAEPKGSTEDAVPSEFLPVQMVDAKPEEREPLGTPEVYGQTEEIFEKPAVAFAALVSGDGRENTVIRLNKELTIVGKLPAAVDIVIRRPTVSRIHARIRRRDGEYFLTDLNSKNGTAVNGKILDTEEYLLKDKDQIDFGEAHYFFVKEYAEKISY